MDLIEGSDDEEQTTEPIVPVVRRPDRRFLNPAPPTSMLTEASMALTIHKGSEQKKTAAPGGALVLMNNPTKAVLYQPIQGPQMADPKRPSTKTPGVVEANIAFDESTFNEQRTAFQRTGRALAPSSTGEVVTRTTLGYTETRLEHFANEAMNRRKRPRFEDKSEPEPLVLGDDDDTQFGIWGPPTREELWHGENALSDLARGGVEGLAPEQLAEREYLQEQKRQKGLEEENQAKEPDIDRLVERKMAHLLPPRLKGTDRSNQPPSSMERKNSITRKLLDGTSCWHGFCKWRSWRGRSQMFRSQEMRPSIYWPQQGCSSDSTFPRTGHLLLSGGLDGKCKVWSIEHKQVMRTYSGHAAGVRDVQFNHDGSKFVSASFDRYLRLWKTETGDVLQTFTNRKVPYVVKFYPHDDNLFVVGCSDNKIVTYDATTGEITQEYNHHLAPVNAILFVEDHGTKMITSSDDKKVLVWEWDIGVPIKYISDPTMHSMPTMTLHPSHQFFVGQSLDNQIVVFQAQNRFAIQRKRRFAGHQVSGYACEMAFSPDGQFLASGDGNGKLCFWEWKRSKLLQKYKAHDKGPTIGCVWHPLEPSVVFTCGWDGVIKMWQ
ncbi:beta-propeller repeat [Fragilaria crotonensis]|nr:beta-propeller repeat [Fragilaria crotonensis]